MYFIGVDLGTSAVKLLLIFLRFVINSQSE